MPTSPLPPFEYKEYKGSIQYSDEDNVFHGSIRDIEDVITYEGKSIQELETEFKISVDEYLSFCNEKEKNNDSF